MHARLAAMAVAIAAALSGSPRALASVDAEVGPSAKVLGSIRPEGDEDVLRFTVGEGATLDLAIARKGKGDLAPSAEVLDADGTTVDLDEDLLKVSEKKFALKGQPLPVAGEYRVVVGGTGSGDYSLKLVAKSASGSAGKARRVDLRGAALGAPEGGEVFASRDMGSGGGVIGIEPGDGTLGGVEVLIPEGALPGATTVSVASAPEPDLDPAEHSAAGPAVALGPSGLVFGTPVTVTIPYDPARFSEPIDPEDLEVLHVSVDGSSEILRPDSVDGAAGLVTVRVSSFSVLMVITGPGRLPGMAGEWWTAGLGLMADPDTTGEDPPGSRTRRLFLNHGSMTLSGGGGVSASSTTWSVVIRNPVGADGSATVGTDGSPGVPGNWWFTGLRPDLRIDFGSAAVDFGYAGDGTVLVGSQLAPEGMPTLASLTLAVRKPVPALQSSQVAGSYHFGAIGIGYRAPGSFGKTDLETSRLFGALVLDPGGAARLSASSRASNFEPGDAEDFEGAWRLQGESVSGNGSWALEGDGRVRVSLPVDAEEPGLHVFRFLPGPGSAVLIGGDLSPDPDALIFGVLVRQGSSVTAAAVQDTLRRGTFRFGDLHVNPGTYESGESPDPGDPGAPGSFPVADLDFGGMEGYIEDPGQSRFRLAGTEVEIRREAGQPGGLLVETLPVDFTGGISVAKSGKSTLSGGGETLVGAVRPDGRFGFLVPSPSMATEDGFLLCFVR